MKYAWIDAERKVFDLAEMCVVLGVSVSGYRAWKRCGKAERKRLTDAQMLALIQAIHAEFKGAYGSPRMVHELRARGLEAGKERVERLMNGFEKELRARILGVVSHATVMGVGDELRDWPMVTAFLGRYPHATACCRAGKFTS